MFDLNKPLVQWTLLLFLAFVWGSSFILMKRGLMSFDNNQVASLRIVISFVFLSPVIIRNFKQIKKGQWLNLLIAGLLGSGIPAFLFTKAQTQISSSLSGMLNSLVPLFTVIIGMLFFALKPRFLKIAGVTVGLIGAIGLLAAGSGFSLKNDDFTYGIYVVIATICYALNINFIKTKLVEVKSLNITSFGFLFIGPFAAIYLFSTDFVSLVQEKEGAWLNFFYICLLSIFGTAIAVILFNMIIKRVSPVFASSVTYIIPIFAIFWGFVDGEEISLMQLIWIGIILTGVYLVNKDNRLERLSYLKEKEKN